MLIKNLNIKPGETRRVVVYIKGKKHYVQITAGIPQSFKKCHGADLRHQHAGRD